jgi:hypothetical protein
MAMTIRSRVAGSKRSGGGSGPGSFRDRSGVGIIHHWKVAVPPKKRGKDVRDLFSTGCLFFLIQLKGSSHTRYVLWLAAYGLQKTPSIRALTYSRRGKAKGCAASRLNQELRFELGYAYALGKPG